MKTGTKIILGLAAFIFLAAATIGFIFVGAALAYRFGPVLIPVGLLLWWLYSEGIKAEKEALKNSSPEADSS